MLTDEEKKSDYLETLAEELRLNGFPVEVEDNGLVIQENYNNKTTKQQNNMKTFTKQEIRDLLNKVVMDEVSFTRMVEIMNERVSEAADIPEKPKKGDFAIFWDDIKRKAIIRMYYRLNEGVEYRRHQDIQGLNWDNAIKLESKEQYERLIRGEI